MTTPTKPSGIPWLGEVPAHWEVKRLRFVVQKIGSGKTPKGGAESYATEGVVFIRSQNVYDDGLRLDDVVYIDDETDEDMAGTRVKPNDVLLNITGASIGRCAPVPDDLGPANVNQHVAIIRPEREKVDQRFLHAILCSQATKAAILADEVGSSREALNFEQIAGLPIILPPLPEQRAIAAFLDERTARIDALVARKRRLVQLLKEKRQALITRAVTRGLDPKAKMKESGVPFTTQVPAHWTITRVKHVAELHTGITLGKQFPESMKLESRPYLRVANVQDGWLKLDHITEIELPPKDIPHYELQPGDVLMTEGGDFDKLGRGTVWEGQIPGCLHQNHIYAVRTDRERLDPYFLSYLLSSGHGRSYFTSNKLQTTNLASTNGTIIKAFPVLLPPIQEQRIILDWLNDRLAMLDGVVSKVEQAVERLQEYRTALISAAVTGKVRVG